MTHCAPRFQGEWVWVDSGIGVPIGARVKLTDTGHQLLVDDEGKEHKLSQNEEGSIRVMHPTSVEGVDDMIRLGDLNEAGLLRNLLVRHRQGIIYTYTGSVLVAVNPYQELPLYTADQVRLYHGRRLGELPPHVFAIADTCYFNMRRHNRDQCCIISGESGAGKTESTKLVLQFLAAVSGQHSWIEQQILEANPILEAFGNAKTIRNDNSSRFGKYVEIFFNKDGAIEGARMEQYLLEKSRVCHQAMEERNYHIFYCMLAGMTAEQKKTLCLGNAAEFVYLKRVILYIFLIKDIFTEYNYVTDVLFTTLLGNSAILNNMESSDVSLSNHFTLSANLLEVQPAALAVSLTYRSFMTNRERVSKPLNSEQAADSRDAFVKAIYGKLFIWIVGRINSAIQKTPINGPKYVRNSIGLLDIFGFENFDSNSFEQLCINFANEQLQQFFVRHVFKLEQEEYTKEDIVWRTITFSDNTDTLDLLAVKPLNVLALIDEESHFPKGTDVTMLNKMDQAHAKCNKYIPSKNTHDMEFGIHHFAGAVHYDSKGFLEKNRDALNSDILKLIDASTNKLLRQLFEKERQVSTLSGQFRQSLDSLMNALSKCQPHFIRCFKPNDDKKSMVFDRNLCIRQLRYSGMIDTIKIRKLGFPIRHTFKQFLQRYRVLLNTTVCDPKTVRHLQRGFERLQSKIRGRLVRGHYLKELAAAVTMQSQVRGYLARKSYKSKREAVTVLQAHTRGMLARKTTNKMKTDVFLSAQEREARERSAAELQQRLEDVLSQSQEAAAKPEPVSEQEMVETMFSFLPNKVAVGGREGPAPEGFEDLERMRTIPEVIEEIPEEQPVVDYDDENEEFSFTKFSALHFQGSATHSHISQRLRQPLLFHEDEGDALVSTQYQASSETITEEKDILIGEGRTLDRPISDLEKLHIIVGYALSRRDIRDEIYCQIIKQLVNNKNQKSSLRGWVLLSICLGIFPPTELLMQYLESFLGRGPSSYGPYCAERLRRVVANGERGEPPCWIELQAVKTKKTTQVSVALMDSLSVSLPVDSACTSAEVCQALAKKVNIKDIYGFSLYIGFCEKVWSLGSGRRHVMDAISQCEQEVRRKGEEEQHAPWRLYFRKELFTPWHDSSIDAVSTDLIYRQVIRGLKSGEYHSEKEDDLVQLAAMYYYVTFGSAISGENAKKVVEECITTELIETKSQGKLIQLVNAAHTQVNCYSQVRSTDSVKGDVVDYARQKWPIYFSKFYEVTQMSGPPLPKSNFIVAINWNGISFQDEKEKKLLELSYPEVTGVNKSRYGQGPVQVFQKCILISFLPSFFSSFLLLGSNFFSKNSTDIMKSVSLATLRGQFLLQSVDAGEMADLIQLYLEGLRERSVYAVALQDINKQGRSITMNHLITHLTDGEYSPDRGWIKGTNERTGNTGAISTDTVLVLPTLEKPSDTTLVRSPDQKKTVAQNVHEREERKPFNKSTRNPLSLLFQLQMEKLWAASKEPIKQPLLKSLVGNTDLSHLAFFLLSLTFPSPILKYMGDYPIKQVRQPIELTDQIFGPATQHVPLQDEVYCQIMRQMTSNSSRYVVDYGWQLMWLCTGLFPPSQTLLRYTQRFLESRPREPLATDCLQRLQMLLRKLPPHQVEVDAIQQNSNQIFHKIHFPNDLTELFEVTSTTRIRDLVRNIAYKLILASADGYGLFMKTPNKVDFNLEDQNYFFDSLRQTTDQPKKTKKVREARKAPATMPYLVIFMRKLWFNVTPGRDLTSDLTFHFPQELPKYLRGYHKCTKEEMISLAGLLFRVKVDTDRSQFVMIPRMLKELVPADEMKTMSPEDWKKHVISSYNKQAGITLDEAKVAFLKGICHWPTFGCAFFEVKQTSEPSYPSIVQIAISKQGVSFIDPKTKELLVMHPFSRITNWSSGSTYFHMTIGNLVKGNTFLCETSLGYKMDDLLSSYVNMYEMQRQAVRPRNNSMFPT
uniref:Myosin VIIB n=1 Tax=Hucho hucho TaxID=62062 RepID=A0A4W5PKL4_9TELE